MILSRTECNSKTGLPRLNMPFELGLFFGAKEFGNTLHKRKKALVLDRVPYRYQNFLSDLNGVDPKAHENNSFSSVNCRPTIIPSPKRKEIKVSGYTL